jgi:hypothetical protein
MSDELNNNEEVIIEETTAETTAEAATEQTTSVAVIFPSIFKDIDFSTLNATIDVLGKHGVDLDKEEKSAASKIVDEWNHNVITRLHNRVNEMNNVVNFFNVKRLAQNYRYNGYYYNSLGEAELTALAASTGTTDLYEQVLKVTNEVERFRDEGPVVPNLDDKSLTALTRMKLKNDYEYAKAKFDIDFVKLDRKLNAAWKAFLTELNTKDQVKQILAKATKYLRNVNTLTSECEAKATLAKLNIQINSEAVRDSLRELMDFTKSI